MEERENGVRGWRERVDREDGEERRGERMDGGYGMRCSTNDGYSAMDGEFFSPTTGYFGGIIS